MNKKDYKGYELVKAIHNREIKDGTKIEVHSLEVLGNIIAVIEYSNKRLEWGTGEFDTLCLFDDDYYFRVLEDNTEEIEELKFELQADNFTANQLKYFFNMNKKVDEIRKAVNEMRKEKSNE